MSLLDRFDLQGGGAPDINLQGNISVISTILYAYVSLVLLCKYYGWLRFQLVTHHCVIGCPSSLTNLFHICIEIILHLKSGTLAHLCSHFSIHTILSLDLLIMISVEMFPFSVNFFKTHARNLDTGIYQNTNTINESMNILSLNCKTVICFAHAFVISRSDVSATLCLSTHFTPAEWHEGVAATMITNKITKLAR